MNPLVQSLAPQKGEWGGGVFANGGKTTHAHISWLSWNQSFTVCKAYAKVYKDLLYLVRWQVLDTLEGWDEASGHLPCAKSHASPEGVFITRLRLMENNILGVTQSNSQTKQK